MLDMLKGLFGLAKESPFKLIIILAIISALTGFVIWYDTSRYNAGFNAAKVEVYEEARKAEIALQEAQEAILGGLQEELSLAKQKSQSSKDIAVALQHKLDNQPSARTYREISNVQTGECINLSPDFRRVLDNIIEQPE
jgi:hypothetical protein